MKCDMAQDSMVLAAYGELHELQAIRLEQHITTCPSCKAESELVRSVFAALNQRPMADPSPNLLARSRVRLDEALDQIPMTGPIARLRMNFFRWVGSIQSAPALAVLLVGLGFLAGNFTLRYQLDHAPKAITITDSLHGSIQNVSGIVRTADPEIVQVLYNQIVPQSLQGTVNDPQIRQLLLLGTREAATNGVRNDSVTLLADECRSGHGCATERDGKEIRAALLGSLRSDKNAGVRLKALEGLQPFVGQDPRVRDAMLAALMHDGSPQVRKAAIGLLEPVEADSSVRQVLRTVSTSDDNPYIRTASYDALQTAESIQ